MVVDPSKLKKPGRRSLGAPPTDGSPGIDDDIGLAHADSNEPAALLSPGNVNGLTAPVSAGTTRKQGTNDFPPSAPVAHSVVPNSMSEQDRQELSATDEDHRGENEDEESASTTAPRAATTGQGRGEQTAARGRQRVPLPEAEARIPFTTRVSISTKERLEDACHYLRVKHQDFINQAIVAHLKKHGF
jgi:hypothetical protein